MGEQRATLQLDDFKPKAKERAGEKEKADQKVIEKVAEQSGFVSREPKRKRRRKISPYTDQLGIKVRPQMKEIFQTIGERMEVYDHTTFENALLALLEKEGMQDLVEEFKTITK